MLLVELPLFARSGLGLGMTMNTVMSSVPFFANWIFSVVYGKCLDMARAKVFFSSMVLLFPNKLAAASSYSLFICRASLAPQLLVRYQSLLLLLSLLFAYC